MPEVECKIYKALMTGLRAIKPHYILHPRSQLMLQHHSGKESVLFGLDLGCRNKAFPLCPEYRVWELLN